MGILDRATEAAKSAVSTAAQAVSDAAQQVGETIESAGNSISQQFSDDTDVDQEQESNQQDGEVEPAGIDPDETPDNVNRGDTTEYDFLSAKREYSFTLTPTQSPTEYLAEDRPEALAEWVQANILTDEFRSLNVDFDLLQLAVRYEVIQDGVIFDTSRRRSERVTIDAPESAAQSLKNGIRGLEKIDEDSYDAIIIISEHIVISAKS